MTHQNRDFLAGVLLSATLPPKKEPRNDEILALQPVPIRKACQDTCPDSFYRILRIVEHQKQKPFTYTVTFINVGPGTAWRKAGDDWIAELPQYQLELDASGGVIEEQAHCISPSVVPKAVLAGYQKWNPKGLTGMTVAWGVGQPRNKKRVFRAMIVFNQVDASGAAFLEDGTLIKEQSDPESAS
jgi:hypothetical protein